jgi:hypothetical protein
MKSPFHKPFGSRSPFGPQSGVSVAVLTLIEDGLEEASPFYSMSSSAAGTLRWDFHSSATPPAAGAGDIATGTQAVGSGITVWDTDLSAYTGTGYLHYRISNSAGTSNILTSQVITVGSAEALQFLSRISSPGSAGRSAYATLIDALVAGSVWSKLDGLYVQAWDGTEATFLVNLKQSSYGGTVTGPKVYNSGIGLRGDGTKGFGGTEFHIDSGFNPSTAGGNYAQNSAHIMAYSFNTAHLPAIANDAEALIGVDTAAGAVQTHIYPRYTDNLLYLRVNDSSAGVVAGIASVDPNGMLLGNRSSSTARQAYKNGTRIDSYPSSASGALTNANLYFGAINEAGTTLAKSKQIFYQAFSWGGSLTSGEVAAFHTALRTYLDSCMDYNVGWNKLLMSCFTTSSENLFVGTSYAGKVFTDAAAVYDETPDAAVRDPSIYRHTDGYLYSAYTRVSGFSDATSTFSIARSTDEGANWTRLGTVECSALTGGAGTGRVWAPKIRKFGSNVYVFFSYDENTSGEDFQPGYIEATNLASMTFGTATAITGTAIPANSIDFYPVLKGSTYYLFCKNETTERINVLSSSSLLSGYDTTETTLQTAIATSIGGDVEAPIPVQLGGDYWRLYFDTYSGAPYEAYIETFDNWTTWIGKTTVSQSALAHVRHATIILD